MVTISQRLFSVEEYKPIILESIDRPKHSLPFQITICLLISLELVNILHPSWAKWRSLSIDQLIFVVFKSILTTQGLAINC